MKKTYEKVFWKGFMESHYEKSWWKGVMKRLYEKVLWKDVMKRCYEKVLWKGIMKWHYETALWKGPMKRQFWKDCGTSFCLSFCSNSAGYAKFQSISPKQNIDFIHFSIAKPYILPLFWIIITFNGITLYHFLTR